MRALRLNQLRLLSLFPIEHNHVHEVYPRFGSAKRAPNDHYRRAPNETSDAALAPCHWR